MGPATIAAAQSCDQDAVLRYFIKQRDARFESIAAKYPQYQKFLAGWKQRDRDLEKFLAV
jgi:lysozyme family protein